MNWRRLDHLVLRLPNSQKVLVRCFPSPPSVDMEGRSIFPWAAKCLNTSLA